MGFPPPVSLDCVSAREVVTGQSGEGYSQFFKSKCRAPFPLPVPSKAQTFALPHKVVAPPLCEQIRTPFEPVLQNLVFFVP